MLIISDIYERRQVAVWAARRLQPRLRVADHSKNVGRAHGDFGQIGPLRRNEICCTLASHEERLSLTLAGFGPSAGAAAGPLRANRQIPGGQRADENPLRV